MQSLHSFVMLGLFGAALVLTSCGDKKERAEQELETSGYQATPADFLRAAENGDVRALELFVKQGIDLGAKDANGWTAMHLAARAKRQESIAFLLESGMAVDTPGLDGVTPLMLAAREGNTTTVRYLLKQGAKPELRDGKKRTALILAVEGGHKACVEELAPFSRNQLDTALLYAASRGKHRVIDTLTSFGASVYVRHEGGMTPLMLAAHHGHTETVRALLDSGANRYAVNEHGWTAAQVAAAAGQDKIAAMLNAQPGEEEMTIAGTDDTDGVEWQAPVDGEASVDGAAVAANAPAEDGAEAAPGPDDGLPWNRPTPAEDGGPMDNPHPLPPKKHLPFIAGKTIPSEGKTTAAVTEDIAMVDYREKPLPLIVEETMPAASGHGSKARMRMLYGQHKKVDVREGDVIPDTRFKVISIRRMLNHSKITDGKPTDVSIVEIEDTRTGERRKMTAKIPATAAEPWAVLRSKGSGKYYAVRAGQRFRTSGGQHYTVTDVRPSQLVLTHNDTGEVITIPMGR